MDQTESQDQGVLRHLRECRKNPDLDRGRCLRPYRNTKEAPEARGQHAHNSTDSQRNDV